MDTKVRLMKLCSKAVERNTEYVGKTEILYFLNTDIIGRKTVQKADLRPSGCIQE